MKNIISGLIISWIICIIPTPGNAQDDALSIQLLQLERAIFEAAGDDEQTRLLIRKSGLLKEAGRIEDALFELNRVQNTEAEQLPDSLRERLHLQRVLLFYLNDNFVKASEEFQNLTAVAEDPNVYQFLGLLIALELDPLSEVKVGLEEYFQRYGLASEGEAVLKDIEYLKEKSMRRATWLSILFPGLGQAYAGDVKGMLAGVGLQGGAATFVALNFIATNYIAAGVGTILFMYFKIGDINRAREEANRFDLQKKEEIKNKIKYLILQNEKILLQP